MEDGARYRATRIAFQRECEMEKRERERERAIMIICFEARREAKTRNIRAPPLYFAIRFHYVEMEFLDRASTLRKVENDGHAKRIRDGACACVALWISSGLDTFHSVAPNWSSLRQAFAPKRNEEEKEEEDRENREEMG